SRASCRATNPQHGREWRHRVYRMIARVVVPGSDGPAPLEASSTSGAQYRFVRLTELFSTRVTASPPARRGRGDRGLTRLPQRGHSPVQLPLLVHVTVQALPPAHTLEHPYVPPGSTKKSPPTAPQVPWISD